MNTGRRLVLAILTLTSVISSVSVSAGPGCEAVDAAAEAAARNYIDVHTAEVLDSSYTPADDLGKQACLDVIMNMNVGFFFSLPDIIIGEIIDAVINAACDQVVAMVKNTKNEIYGELASYADPYGLGQAAFGITDTPGVQVTTNPIQTRIPQFMPNSLLP